MKRFSFFRNEKGQAMAEAAYVLPIITAIFIGILVFGYTMYAKVVVVDAARDGARHVALGLGPADSIVQTIVTDGQLKTSNIVSVTPTDMGDYVTVQVTYKQDTFVPGIGLLLGGQNLDVQTGCTSCIYLSHTATFKKEN